MVLYNLFEIQIVLTESITFDGQLHDIYLLK